jgi:hypothetical protein
MRILEQNSIGDTIDTGYNRFRVYHRVPRIDFLLSAVWEYATISDG